jgi:hypothetical protein
MEDRSSRRMRTLVTQMARSRPVRESDRRRADIHDGPEHNALQPEAGYIDARPYLPDRRNPLATHGRTIHLGQSEKSSVRVYVFRFALELGHCSTQPALRVCADTGSALIAMTSLAAQLSARLLHVARDLRPAVRAKNVFEIGDTCGIELPRLSHYLVSLPVPK